ncbi:MAG: hypothetical protein CVU36_08640 [Betaproteobacteria bacterium HGW-Betaproteobacteria-9]|jgi:hypothetical protein|nr:MAG: hypothetical protein CVU36_08640 [Betaproteobacteria bacterium HGW-Betaproteobacteria-9]
MSAPTTTSQPAECELNTIELNLHVKALLDAIAWMGEASFRLSEIDVMCSICPDAARTLDGIASRGSSNPGAIVRSLAWVAADLMRISQDQQNGGAA